MIVACPSCKAKFRIDESRIQPPGVRLRCARCQTMFAVRKRVLEAAPAVSAGEGVGAAAHPGNASSAEPSPAGPGPSGSAAPGAAPKVLVAHESLAFLTGVTAQVEREGYEVLAARDGVEALMRIQREMPQAVVIDAALPKMYGFEICEFMKRNESLRGIRVVLVASDNGRARYKRSPGNLYGADDYVEIHDIPQALPGILRRLLGDARAGAPPGAERSREALVPEAPATTAGDGPEVPPGGRADSILPEVPPGGRADRILPEVPPGGRADSNLLEAEREKARRLARIIVSDIGLYNEAVIQEGIRNGRLLEMLRDDLEEGYRLFRTRVPASIAQERDYVREALMAFVEKKRGAAASAAADPAPPASAGWDPKDASSGSGADDDSF